MEYPYKERVESAILNINLKDDPKNLYDPIHYIFSLGGKRLRPIFVLLAYQLNKDDIDKVIQPAIAVEAFHNFTLMHDDIMDKAPLRRGKDTVHNKWNDTVAILSGDTLMVKTYELLLLHTPKNHLFETIQKFNKCAIEVCEGQQLDMDFESMDIITEDQYLDMIRLKTAVLLGFCLEYGGILADMNPSQLEQLRMIGVDVGIGFQLMDDLLDVYGDKDKFGKQVGGDIVSNKKTYLLIKALELANKQQLEELKYWINKKEYKIEEKITAIKKIYGELNIYDLTKKKMDSYYKCVSKNIETLDKIPTERKENLKRFLEKLIKREQ